MKILEKPFCEENFQNVKTLEDIKNSSSNSTLVFDYCESSLDLYAFCKTNAIPFAVRTKNVKEMIFSVNLGAKYIFCDTIKNAKKFQKIADEYLFDTKIVYLTDDLNNIEEIINTSVDAIKLKGDE